MNENLITNMYFVAQGQRTGQFLLLVDFDTTKKIYSVLAFPESEPIYVAEKDITEGLKLKILESVEALPSDVFTECKQEFEYRVKNTK